MIRAINVYQHAPWPPAPARLIQSLRGSLSFLLDRWTPEELRVLTAAVVELENRVSRKISDQIDTEGENETGQVMAQFMPQLDAAARQSARRLASALRRDEQKKGASVA